MVPSLIANLNEIIYDIVPPARKYGLHPVIIFLIDCVAIFLLILSLSWSFILVDRYALVPFETVVMCGTQICDPTAETGPLKEPQYQAIYGIVYALL